MQTTANSTYTVLVVDDDIALNHLLRDALSDVGFNVLTSSNGLKGLNTIRYGSKVDVVLLDYSMPVVDGSQTLEYLTDRFPKVKTIGITGFNTAELPDDYRNKVGKLLTKPIMISDLVAAIHSVLGISVDTKKSGRTTHWMQVSLRCILFAIFSYGFLRILDVMVNEALFSK
jgi:DNA-binding NtrC family response regulator